ncbi:MULTISPECIES: HD domain-containing protein [Bacillus]|uniref:HD domain-containing protein n=1 Tax=Bacillus TaxID=1386 RepID=UPI0001A13690|nr:HD domain-containing protein [Bacillus pseudomycoides]EEM17191.1 Hydrolase, HD [Bacillus pseudomycoides DSM 12442]MED1599217.1 HD domain-containing protein [Bacillus pseudomycoides]MED4710498.1 HD domain-containing protein [Bacillus pseudomycoides]OOR49681.1 phosphohydrolase [Bacillus pseudomycoides]PDY14636.1 HD domain-containing protein [Bacillus pseudomycoides]
MKKQEKIQKTVAFVRGILETDASGHDWYHIERVHKLALSLSEKEGGDRFVIEMAALLHDVADEKLNESEEAGMKKVSDWLEGLNVTEEETEHILHIIMNMSYKGGHGGKVSTLEGKIVQDADRLDALGAIGIARTFAYGGAKGRLMYDPNIPPREEMTKEEYRKNDDPSLNHFYEKLLKLKDLMNTDAAKREAEIRHRYMEEFIEQFMKEWNAQI